MKNRQRQMIMAGILSALLQAGCSVFGVQTVEEPDYKVVEAVESEDIEVRQYGDVIVARTSSTGNYDDATRDSFRRLFDYIQGENNAGQEIAMTAPVEQQEKQREEDGEKIQMTAPVFQEEDAERGWTMSFVMPEEYTMETIPQPTNKRVVIEKIAPRQVAVLSFTGRFDDEDLDERGDQLLAWVEQSGYEATSKPRVAGYNAPFTIPFLRRNEIQVDIARPRASR